MPVPIGRARAIPPHESEVTGRWLLRGQFADRVMSYLPGTMASAETLGWERDEPSCVE